MIQSNILLTDIVIPTVDNLIVTDVQDEVIIKDSDIMSTTLTITLLNSEFIPHESQNNPSLLDLNTTEFNNLSNEIVVTPTIQNNGMLLNTDIPVYDNAVPTDLSLNTNSPSNNDVLGSYESVNAIPSITPGSGSLFPSDPTLLPQINSLFELLQYLSEVMMRFNSDPNYYMQDDFAILVKTITNALIHLYLNAPLSTGEVEGLYAALGTKVDKILGKGLSTNDLTDELKAAYDQAFLETHIHNNKGALDLVSGENTGDQDLSGLQPKETGKGLSTNDFTNADKSKLDGIQTRAEANVNADWNATSGDALILNKPSVPNITGLATETYVQNYAEPKKGTDDNYVTDSEKANLHAPHSDDQDLSGLVVKVPGKSLVLDTEIAKIHTAHSDDQDLTPYETIVNNNIKLAGKEPANPNIQAHIANTNNPHFTTKAQVGLSQVDNTSDLNKPISILTQIALNTKEPNITIGLTTEYWRGDKTFQTLDKNAVGLDQVDNTSDLLKPISTATQSALDLKIDKNNPIITGSNSKITYDSNGLIISSSQAEITDVNGLTTALTNKLETSLKGTPNGLAELDGNGFVKNSQLPSYVDDVLEYTTISLAPIPGESGKIYVDLTTNITYRWSGTQYSIISDTIALGETSTTAYRGDRGKIAYDHSQLFSGNPHNTTKSDLGLSNVDNVSDLNKPISTATQTALNTKEPNITIGLTTQYWRGDKSWQILNKAAVGLPNVDNTSDANKPISIAIQSALDTKLPLQTITDTKGLSGFIDSDNINISYNYTNRTITLTGNLSYVYRGVVKTLTSPWISAAHAATQGTWFLYSSDGTNFNWSQTVWNFEDIMITSMRYGVSTATSFAIRETHGTMDYKTHEELHSQIGTYRVSGGQVTVGSYTYNTATDSANSPGFDLAVVKDEDIQSTIPTWVKGTYTTAYIGASNTMVFNITSTLPFIATTNTFIQVNDPIIGTLTAGSHNNYYNVYQILIPATSDIDSQKYRMIMLQPQNTYSSLASAQAEDVKELVLGNLSTLSLEFVIYARITYITSTPNSNIGKCRIATNGITYVIGNRVGQVSVAGFTGNNHAVLSNLSWLTSGHIGTPSKLPAFDASGLATELTTNSAFNKSFGTLTTQVWGYDAHPTTILGYGITDIPTYDGTNFIQNQNTSAQTGNMWISGSIKTSFGVMHESNATNLIVGDNALGGYVILGGLNRGQNDDGSVLLTSRYSSTIGAGNAEIKFRTYDGTTFTTLGTMSRIGIFNWNKGATLATTSGGVVFGSGSSDAFAFSIENQYTLHNPTLNEATRFNVIGNGTSSGVISLGRTDSVRTVTLSTVSGTSDLIIGLNPTNTNANSTVTYAKILGGNGALMLQNGGTFTSNGARLQVGGSISGSQFWSDTTTLAPFTVASSILVDNLNADYLDGQHGSYYSPTTHTHSYLPLTGGTLNGVLNGTRLNLSSIIGMNANQQIQWVDSTSMIYGSSGVLNFTGVSTFNSTVTATQFNGSGTGLTGSAAAFSSTPLSHTHGNITNSGLIGTTASLPIITGTGGIIQVGSFGTTVGTFCQGNDSRLSDSRVASDVYAWAKASIKPSYIWSEIGSKPTTISGYAISDFYTQVISGFVVGANSTVLNTDTLESAIEKLQGQINNKQALGSYAVTTHTHGNITNGGLIGTVASLPIITGTGGILQVGSFGIAAGTFCQGNDSRLTAYSLPTASSTVLGGVKIGSGITNTSGVISVSTNYQTSITLTTTGTSGASTFIGNTLNIPNYASNASGDSYTCTPSNISNITSSSINIALYTKTGNVYNAFISGFITASSAAPCIIRLPMPSIISGSVVSLCYGSISFSVPLGWSVTAGSNYIDLSINATGASSLAFYANITYK